MYIELFYGIVGKRLGNAISAQQHEDICSSISYIQPTDVYAT